MAAIPLVFVAPALAPAFVTFLGDATVFTLASICGCKIATDFGVVAGATKIAGLFGLGGATTSSVAGAGVAGGSLASGAGAGAVGGTVAGTAAAPMLIPALAIASVVGVGGYLLFGPASSTPSATTNNPDPDDDEPPKRDPKKVKGKLFSDDDLEKMYNNLRKKAPAEDGPSSNRTIWKNDDFRIDGGHLDRARGVRHWELQVNRDPKSAIAKKLLKRAKGKRTHEKFFVAEFNFKNPPRFEAWKKEFRVFEKVIQFGHDL